MCMHIIPLGILIENRGLACDVTGTCSENLGCMLSFVVCKIESLLQTPGGLLILATFPLVCYFCINNTFTKLVQDAEAN